MNRRATAAAAALAMAAPLCTVAAPACTLPSSTGRLCVAVEPQATPQVGRYAAWKVRITDREGVPADVALSVRGGMPAHGHGLPSKPAVRRTAGGEFQIEGLLFNMPGDWVVVFDMRSNSGAPDSAAHRFSLGH